MIILPMTMANSCIPGKSGTRLFAISACRRKKRVGVIY